MELSRLGIPLLTTTGMFSVTVVDRCEAVSCSSTIKHSKPFIGTISPPIIEGSKSDNYPPILAHNTSHSSFEDDSHIFVMRSADESVHAANRAKSVINFLAIEILL